jgi:hypothetical protein
MRPADRVASAVAENVTRTATKQSGEPALGSPPHSHRASGLG